MTAPVGAAPVTYTVGGKQYVSVAVGGESHNDVVAAARASRTRRGSATTASTRSSLP